MHTQSPSHVSDTEKGHEERVDRVDASDDSGSANLERDEGELPPGYFRSRFFVGSMMGIGLGLMAGVAGFGYAAPILAIINADIGPVRWLLGSTAEGKLTGVLNRIRISFGLP